MPSANVQVPLYKTYPQTCSYYSDRQAQYLLLDPENPDLAKLYDQALARGFRRSGTQLYKPQCAGCMACTPYRLPVNQFKAKRNQKRCLVHNEDVSINIQKARYTDHHFALYKSYLTGKHANAGMDHSSADDFASFLLPPWDLTWFIECYLDKQLIAVAVTDETADALSAVYTFYTPSMPKRSLGTFAILQQIKLAQQLGKPYLYLGYWIKNHPKMDYKRHFSPAEILKQHGWQPCYPKQGLPS